MQDGRGYDAYDLVITPAWALLGSHSRISQWDLGEFEQKGGIATRWGTREEFLSACQKAKTYNIGILIDAVLNVS